MALLNLAVVLLVGVSEVGRNAVVVPIKLEGGGSEPVSGAPVNMERFEVEDSESCKCSVVSRKTFDFHIDASAYILIRKKHEKLD